VVVSGGVVKSGLEIIEVPPLGTSNQSITPAGVVACKFADVPEQTEVPEAVGVAGGALTLTITGTRELTHPLVTASK
jgi:hypothetical protein